MRWDRNFTILPYAYGLNARHIKGELKEFHALLDHLSLHQRSWTCRHLSPRTMAFTAILLFLYYFYCNTDKYSQQKFFSEFRQNAKITNVFWSLNFLVLQKTVQNHRPQINDDQVLCSTAVNMKTMSRTYYLAEHRTKPNSHNLQTEHDAFRSNKLPHACHYNYH